MDDIDWAKRLGVLIADALADAKVISKSEMPRAADVAAEEILVRLSMRDRPIATPEGSQS